ncbi:MAG: hypothetical protein IT462_02945 [Planctomycetes bacterium]|nr:hypothetical protein [Planctomycetota bacterium]
MQTTRNVQKNIHVRPVSVLNEPVDYTIVHWKRGEVHRALVRSTKLPVGHVQICPDGYLLVGGRCAWHRTGADKNALVVDPTGKELRQITLGDGIADVRVTHDGSIWASYFDEGVFGNFGWARPGPSPVGEDGIVQFDAHGAIKWRFNRNGAVAHRICDVYAFNVVGNDEFWTCFYTDFPIVHFRDGVYEVFEYGKNAGHAIAAKGRRVLGVGNYDNPQRARILELGKGRVTASSPEIDIVNESEEPLPPCNFAGIGPVLYVVANHQILRINEW